LAELSIRALEIGERAFEFDRALAHLRLEDDGGLKEREGRALRVHAALDAVDEGGVDLSQLADLARELGDARRRLDARMEVERGHQPELIAMPVKVWFTCIELNCSP
jgi:hypothetical protein